MGWHKVKGQIGIDNETFPTQIVDITRLSIHAFIEHPQKKCWRFAKVFVCPLTIMKFYGRTRGHRSIFYCDALLDNLSG